MERIGVFICNYNGKEYLLNCIDSLRHQTLQTFDTHVVDNASTDGSVEAVRKKFGDSVSVICNPENLGGAGGFDRGLRTGLLKQYEYIVLLDNDIILDEQVLENMCSYLDMHEEVGLVGSKVMIMDKPDTIQDYGNYLDFETFRERLGYMREKDDESLPLENVCDYVPSCAIMLRSQVLRKVGTMPADNFIYYDDIELSHKIALSGSKIVALGNTRVWHKGGFRKAEVNTFSKYYFLRNRLHFFAKYIRDEDVARFVDVTLRDVFSQLSGFYNKGMEEMLQTTMYAFDDFLHQVRGKAAEYKIFRLASHDTPFVKAVREKRTVTIKFVESGPGENPLKAYQDLLDIITIMQKNVPQRKLWISLEQCNCDQEEFVRNYQETIGLKKQEYPLPEILFVHQDNAAPLVLRMCGHVKDVKETIFPEIYVDKYCNCIIGEEDYHYFTRLETNMKFFMEIYRPMMIKAVKSIRESMRDNAKTVDDN